MPPLNVSRRSHNSSRCGTGGWVPQTTVGISYVSEAAAVMQHVAVSNRCAIGASFRDRVVEVCVTCAKIIVFQESMCSLCLAAVA